MAAVGSPLNGDLHPTAIDLAHETPFALGRIEVRPPEREVVSGDRREILEPRVMEVLVALARRRGEVVSRDDLIQSCWGGRIVGDDAVNRCVAGLRRLADRVGGFDVETITRVGYRLTVDDSGEPKRPRVPRWVVALAAGATLVAILVGGWWFIARPGAPGSAARVAVLPFDTPDPSHDADAFAGGLLDEILGALSNDHVETVSRTESAALRGSTGHALIKRLGVGLLLNGSVFVANGAISVRLHLDDPARRAIIWSEAFERPTSEADALQAEVAAKAARVTAQASRARAAGVSDPAVLSDFVTGDEHVRFDLVAGWAAAEPLFRRVIAQAPRFAGGHASLANSQALQSLYRDDGRAAEHKAEAEREAQTALKLDPRGYHAFIALALLRPQSDWRGRETILTRGAALDPTEAVYPYFLSIQFADEGRLKAATESVRRAVALDPFWPGPTMYFGLFVTETGGASEGLQILDRLQRLWPHVWANRDGQFWAAALYGDPDAAIALLADARAWPAWMDPRSAELWRASLSALKSNRPDARAHAAAAVKAAADAGLFRPNQAVLLLVRFGEVDSAYAVADRSPEQFAFDPLSTMPPVLFLSQTAPLRRDPRFMRLVAKLGLVDYWRSTGHWPDFCSEPGLPYDCKAEAARVSTPATA